MTLDELLLEWSYKSEKGYPSLDNPSDISILKQILEDLNLPSDKIIQSLKEQETSNDEEDTTFPFHLLGLNGLIGVTANFFECNDSIGPFTDWL